MRHNWPLATIADCAADEPYSTQIGPFGEKIRAESYVSRGAPVLRGTNVNRDGRFYDDDFVFIDEAVAERDFSKFVCEVNDVILCHKGTLGKIGIIPKSTRFKKYIMGNSMMKVRCNTTKLEPTFLYYWLCSRDGQGYLFSRVSQVGVPQIQRPLTTLREAVLPLPPLPEQRAIAAILGTLDDKIELDRRTSETLEAMARALFKSWFVDFDPVRAKSEGRRPNGIDAETAALFPDTLDSPEGDEIPKGWRMTSLGVEAERCGGAIQTGPFGSQLHASDYVAEGVPVVMPKDILGRRVSTGDIARVRESDAERLARHRLQIGDLVYSRRGDVERHALVSSREVGWLCGTGCLLVRLGPRWPSPAFASFALDRPETRAWISQHAIGATMPNLNTGILSAVPLVVPPDDVLRAFARRCDPLQDLIVAKGAESAVLTELRDALLPKLLSGEIRIKDAEKLASAAL
jgi:type I restriction enzyme, S subunit